MLGFLEANGFFPDNRVEPLRQDYVIFAGLGDATVLFEPLFGRLPAQINPFDEFEWLPNADTFRTTLRECFICG